MGILATVMEIKDKEDAAKNALANLPQTLVQGYMQGLAIKEKQAEIENITAQAQARQGAANLDTLMKASTLKKNAADLGDQEMFDLGNAMQGSILGTHTDYRQAIDPAVASIMPPVLAPVAVTKGSSVVSDVLGEDKSLNLDSIVPKEIQDAANEKVMGKPTENAKLNQKIAEGMISNKFKEEKPPTAGQETTALYASRIKQANDVFGSMEKYLNNMPVIGTAINKAVPNFMKGEDFQAYEQAQKNFLNAVLRRESGAVISPSEFQNGKEQYFPQPGDKPQVLAQKKANRDLVMQNFVKSAGKAYVAYDETSGVKKTEQKASSKNFVEGKVYRDAQGNKAKYQNGEWVSPDK
jgi:hypothetical protein